MNPSLSVILPLYNAEATLARQVGQLLDVLPDLATRFEILVVDDGSTDHTDEIAHDLRQQYPQLKIARSDASHSGPTQRAPGFLRKLRDLAIGE